MHQDGNSMSLTFKLIWITMSPTQDGYAHSALCQQYCLTDVEECFQSRDSFVFVQPKRVVLNTVAHLYMCSILCFQVRFRHNIASSSYLGSVHLKSAILNPTHTFNGLRLNSLCTNWIFLTFILRNRHVLRQKRFLCIHVENMASCI